jgi:exopolyphosphatase/pppGpp-phosphohydrolase
MRLSSTLRAAPVAPSRSSAARTFAAIDMGSSSAKMLVLRAGADGRWKTVLDVKQGTFLGKDIGADKVLPKANEERALKALTAFVEQAKKYGVEPGQIGMIATAVMRNTVNGPAFARQIQEQLGLKPHVLAGDREAELGYLGAIAPFRKKGQPQRFASLDLGGGSFQLAIGDGQRMQAGASTQVGSNFVLEKYFQAERISPSQLAAADAALKTAAPMPLDTKRLQGRELVATGGISKFLRAHFHKDVITRGDIEALRRKVGALGYDERVTLVQQGKSQKAREALGVDTADGARDYGVKLPASATLLLRILDGLGVDEVRVSQTDARHAVIARLRSGVPIDR